MDKLWNASNKVSPRSLFDRGRVNAAKSADQLRPNSVWPIQLAQPGRSIGNRRTNSRRRHRKADSKSPSLPSDDIVSIGRQTSRMFRRRIWFPENLDGKIISPHRASVLIQSWPPVQQQILYLKLLVWLFHFASSFKWNAKFLHRELNFKKLNC